MSGRAVSNPQNAQQSFDSGPQLYRYVPQLHATPSPSHSALTDSTHFTDFVFAYHGLPDQSSLIALADHTHTFQSPTAFPRHQAMSGLAHSGLPFGALPTGNRSQSMEGSKAPPQQISPASNALEDTTTDEFGLSSLNRADGADLGGKPKQDKADATPAWSGLKTKAGKERKRLPLACIACRQKKICCSGEKPACKHCLRSHIPCVYKVTTRKAASRTDHKAIHDKLQKRIEDRTIKVIPKADQGVASSVSRTVAKPATPGTVPSSKPTKKRGAEKALGPDLEAWAKAPSKPKIEGVDRPSSLRVQEAEENKLQHEGTEALPSKKIQEHLAEVFFDNVYGQSYHLLHKPSYMQQLKNGTLPPVLVLTLHKDLEYDPSGRNGTKTQLSFIDREIRRRIMWACFLMDRFDSSGTDRPMFIREDTILIPLPMVTYLIRHQTTDTSLMHENMGVAAFMIRAIALWGRIITYLREGGKDLDPSPLWEDKLHYMKHLNDVVNLEARLPFSLKYSAENLEVHKTEKTLSQFLFMHICLQHNILFMSRAAMSARKQHAVHDDLFSEESKRTFDPANRISELLREAEQLRCSVSAPFAGYCVYSSATVHILGIISRNPSMKPIAEANLTTNVKYLHKMKKY
ncbi:hypothetical protein LZL87_014358 [Fusarium oxysporum]|nr:hypothetical protein LZL87_014358 [Fusarium oxysporum]